MQQAVVANPLLKASTLEFQFPPFDQLKDEHYAPAIEQGMREQIAEVEAIANQKDAPSFDNTIVALEKTGALFNRATTVFFNLAGTVTNDAMNKVRADTAPKLAAHLDAILLNDALFQRVKSLYDRKADLKLDAESERLLWRYYTDFVRAGANLDAAQKDTLKKLNAEIATLQTTFTQNVLDESNASAVYVEDRKQLDGLPEGAIAAAAAAALPLAASATRSEGSSRGRSFTRSMSSCTVKCSSTGASCGLLRVASTSSPRVTLLGSVLITSRRTSRRLPAQASSTRSSRSSRLFTDAPQVRVAGTTRSNNQDHHV